MTYDIRMREYCPMIRNLFARIILTGAALLAVLFHLGALGYRGLVGLTVGSRKGCDEATVDVLQTDGTTRQVRGCAAAAAAYERAAEAHRRADAAYMHSSRVKGQVESAAEPKTVEEMMRAQPDDEQQHAPAHRLNGRYQAGQPTR